MVKKTLALATIVVLGVGCPARADSVADFYRNKTVTVTVGYSPGGAYDALARILAKHMPAHLPGNPTMVVKNVPGAGSLVLANQMYNVQPRDGTTFGILARGIAMDPLIGHSATKYDSTKFTWLGSAANETSLCVTYGDSPVKSWEDGLKTQFTVAGNGAGSDPDVFANVLRGFFGLKTKLVSGYPGTAEISIAMERGEVDGRCGWSWTSIKSEKAQWVADKKLYLIVQLALSKAPDLPDVPLVIDLAKTDRQRQIMKLIFSRQTLGRPFAAPPEVPEDRKAALREAFDKTMKDPAFLDETQRRKIEINPVSGAEVDALMAELYRTPEDILAETRKAME
jgi:tripartite-type tricarboxylate transporter receptor subunit TctC